MTRGVAHAKINLALVVGPPRPDGKHEVATVLQRIELADDVALDPGTALAVTGYADDTLVRGALERLAAAAGVEPRWRVALRKRIPIASGLGGGSSDAAVALQLANRTLPDPLSPARLHELAAAVGADVPFFLRNGPQVGRGDGTELEPIELPREYWIVLLLPHGARKESTAAVYASFDARRGEAGWDARRRAFDAALTRIRRAEDLAELPPNDLASSPAAAELGALGAFRADVSGAGPVVYGLFADGDTAARAQRALAASGRTWLTRPAE